MMTRLTKADYKQAAIEAISRGEDTEAYEYLAGILVSRFGMDWNKAVREVNSNSVYEKRLDKELKSLNKWLVS